TGRRSKREPGRRRDRWDEGHREGRRRALRCRGGARRGCRPRPARRHRRAECEGVLRAHRSRRRARQQRRHRGRRAPRPHRARRWGVAAMSPFRGSAAFTERWQNFDLSLEDGVATVTFSRPDKLNALTFDVYADLRDLLGELPHRGDTQVLVLTGQGRGFCSGGDVEEIIGELQQMGAAELLEFTRMSGAVVKAMREAPLPIVAAVNGVAAGAGAVLALAADLRLVARSAKFSFLFTRVGLAGADMGAAYLLPRLVGLGRATELLVLGEAVDAAGAAAIGLATRLVDDEQLAAAAGEL